MAVPSPEPPYNTTSQTASTTQSVDLSVSSRMLTGIDGGKTTGNE